MQEMIHKVSTHFAELNGGDVIHGQAMALKQLWSLTLREAQVQTFADAFRVIAVCFVIATVMVPLLRKVASPAAPRQMLIRNAGLKAAPWYILWCNPTPGVRFCNNHEG